LNSLPPDIAISNPIALDSFVRNHTVISLSWNCERPRRLLGRAFAGHAVTRTALRA
jgi:hypothetical protein